ncbi:MAG: 30S ribosomal protein S6 [Planctomycetaceae bacterium]
MALKLYECMFLLDSGKWAIDPQGTEQVVRDLLERCGADIVHLTPFQEGRLPYEIEGQRKGLHLLTYFKMDGSQVQELTRLCKLSDIVLRQMVIEHPQRLFDLMIDSLRAHAEGETEATEEASA